MNPTPSSLRRRPPNPTKNKPASPKKWLIGVALIVAIGGASLSHWYNGSDQLTDEQAQQRLEVFNRQGAVSAKKLSHSESLEKLKDLPISDTEKDQLKMVLNNKNTYLSELVVWDDMVEDGDIIKITSMGYEQTVYLKKAPQTFYFPSNNGTPLNVLGVHDGGGGITLGFTGTAQPIYLPVLIPGQSVQVRLP